MKWKIEKELKYKVVPEEEIALEVLKITKEDLLRIIAYFFINFKVDQNYIEMIAKSEVEKKFGIKNGVMDITGMPLDSHSYYSGDYDYQIWLDYYRPIHGYQNYIIYL